MNNYATFEQMSKHYCLVTGRGSAVVGGNSNLMALDAAYRDAGIGDYNLCAGWRILPAGAELTDNIDENIPAGSFLPAGIAVAFSTANYQFFGAGVAVGIPRNKTESGIILTSSFTGDPRSRFALAEADSRDLLPAWKARLEHDVMSAMQARHIACEGVITHVITDCSYGLRASLYTREEPTVTARIAAVCLW